MTHRNAPDQQKTNTSVFIDVLTLVDGQLIKCIWLERLVATQCLNLYKNSMGVPNGVKKLIMRTQNVDSEDREEIMKLTCIVETENSFCRWKKINSKKS